MERDLVGKAAEAFSVVTPNKLTSMASHSSGSAAASSAFYSACSEASEATSSIFYSTRIEGLSELRSKTENQSEFDIESSRSHWTEVSAVSDDSDDEQVSNRVAFESLKNDLYWGPLFRKQKYDELEIGAKIAEGGQAEIFEAFGRPNVHDHSEKVRLVPKVFKKGYSLVDLQRLWPPGIASDVASCYMLASVYFDFSYYFDLSYHSRLCWPEGVHLLDDGRFAFILPRFRSDLRKLIDQIMLGSNGRPPFSTHKRMHYCIKDIVEGMHHLHEVGIIHNDLKAANVLVSYSQGYNVLQTFVAHFESSNGIVGTRFWRSPENLLAVKDHNMRQEIYTKQSDMCSFAMTCYH